MSDIKIVISLGLSVFGMTTNLLLLVALWRTQREWHRLNRQLVGPIAGFDFIATLFIVLSSILSFSMGSTQLLESSWYCLYMGVPLQTLPVFSVVLLAAMSIDRYLLVVNGEGVSCLWGWLFISSLCLGATAMKTSNAMVHGLRPDPTVTYCQTFGSGYLTKFNQHLSNFIFLFGVVVISFSYLGIYVFCRKTPVAFQALPRGYLFILFAYQTCLFPKFITSLWKLFYDKKTIPHLLIILTPLGFNLLYVVNPCLVLAFQASLRKELYFLFFPNQGSGSLQLSSEAFNKPYSSVA